MRYGENPHQNAAFYHELVTVAGSIANYTQVQGKELSYNNIGDADATWELVKTFDQCACVIVKHANSLWCGHRRYRVVRLQVGALPRIPLQHLAALLRLIEQ